jgi:UDP-glucose:(heptosyl)LPS alpha-1,3-glucosyltransferase
MVKQTARAHYALPEEKLVTLFNAVDPAKFDPEARPDAGVEVRRRFGIGPDKVVALVVAQDFRRKGVAPAIEALARLNDPRLVLLVVGKPDPRAYQQLAAKAGVSDRVIFAGPTPDTYASYRAGDFFVLPTHHDPCSLVVLEAVAMGLPTITTTLNGAHEIMTEGTHGHVLTDPADAAALAEAMHKMLDPGKRREMSRACLALRPHLSYKRHLEQLEGLYEQTVNSRRSSVTRTEAAASA